MNEFLGQWSAEQSLGTEETAPREPGCQGSTCLEIPGDFFHQYELFSSK